MREKHMEQRSVRLLVEAGDRSKIITWGEFVRIYLHDMKTIRSVWSVVLGDKPSIVIDGATIRRIDP